MTLGSPSGGAPPEFEKLEELPAVGGVRKPAELRAITPSAADSEQLEELPMVEQSKGSVRPERDASRKRARPAAHVSVHTIRDLLDLVATDLPAVAAEGGIFRVQPHAYDGFLGRDPGLSRLAAAVIGDSATDRRLDDGVVPVRPQDCEPLPLFARGIDLDAFRAGQGKDEAEERFRGTLNRLCRRTDALGAALLVRDRSGGYRPSQVHGILRRSADRLAFASDDPVSARYLARRVALIAAGPPRLLTGMEARFSGPASTRISRLALLPAQADGMPAYLLLTAPDGDSAWDVHTLVLRLGLVGVEERPPP